MSEVHPTAFVDSKAEIGEGTTIGAFSLIGPNVKIGKGCRIGSHVVIEGHTKIGDRNNVFQFASIGAVPQDLKYKGEDSILEIGDDNIIREYVTLQPGTEGGGMLTKVGSKNLFMAGAHVGHDSFVGNENIFANQSALAGHVIIGDYTTIGGLAAIHQFVKIGNFAFLGGGSMVAQDIPPYCMAQGDRAQLVGINSIGLQRRGVLADEIKNIKACYRKLFVNKEGTLKSRVAAMRDLFSNSDFVLKFIDFIESSERGVASARTKDS